MKPSFLARMCDPRTHEALELRTEPVAGRPGQPCLLNPRTGQRFPIRDGIPVFLREEEVTGSNRRYQALYDRIAPFYDLLTSLGARFRGMTVETRLREYLDELEVGPRSLVLEVSVGTGRNLQFLPRSAEYVGLDISWGMLKRCWRNAARWGLDVNLCQGEAEQLPFQDNSFDVVFSFGGINFFNDKAAALREMIRVARPGTRLVVGDETETASRGYQKVPLAGRFYSSRQEGISATAELLPPGMEEVRTKLIAGGELYYLCFRTPRS